MRTLLLALSLASATVSAQPPDASAEALLACMRDNVPETLRIQEVRLTTVDRDGGEREMRGRMYGTRENDKVNVMFRIEAPTDLAGASYLIREAGERDDMYLYLPVINKVRRIRGSSTDGKLFGTDLSYRDIKQVQNAYSAAEMELGQRQDVGGRETRALSLTPADPDSMYQRLELRVDIATCVALEVDFVSADGPRKELRVDPEQLRQSGRYWYAGEVQVRDLLDGTRTRLTVSDVRSDGELSGRYFNPRMFYLGN